MFNVLATIIKKIIIDGYNIMVTSMGSLALHAFGKFGTYLILVDYEDDPCRYFIFLKATKI